MAFVVAAIWKAKEGEEKRVEDDHPQDDTAVARGREATSTTRPRSPRTTPAPSSSTSSTSTKPDTRRTRRAPYFQENVFNYIIKYLEERSVKTYQTIDV